MSFAGLSIGLSSLYAQRAGLELTGHNLANANTEGYSRQRVGMASDGGPITPAVHASWDGTGNGVTVADIQRLRDVFLDTRALHERGELAGLSTQQLVLGRVESILAEPSESGIQSQLSDFWAGWDDVANKPTDAAARNQLLERAQTLSFGINAAVDALSSQRDAFSEQLRATVADINATGDAIADYNKAITSAAAAGTPVPDLMDKRDLLVQKLGEFAGVTVRPTMDETKAPPVPVKGSIDVLIGGTPLVSGRQRLELAVTGTTAAPSVVWADGASTPAAVRGSSGQLLSAITSVLPSYVTALSGIAEQLATTVNAQHAAGSTADGAAGTPLFTVTGGRLALAFTDPARIAASATPGGTSTGDSGGGNALKLAALGELGGPDATYRALVVKMGVDTQTANRRVDIQASILGQVDAARESQSGVSIDEEMTNMLAYQRAYEGAARFVSAVDQMLDTLINRTGIVGR